MHDFSPQIATLLAQLSKEWSIPPTLALVVTGSYARGDAQPESDLDLLRFVAQDDIEPSEAYILRYEGNLLVSISTTTFEDKRAELANPIESIYIVSALRQAYILYDPLDTFASLQADAVSYRRDENMQRAADALAASELYGTAEEVHKLLRGLRLGEESTVYNAVHGITVLLRRAIAVYAGVLITSDNSYFAQLSDAAHSSPDWVRLMRIASAVDGPDGMPLPLMERGHAALGLYYETASLLRHTLNDEQFAVVARVLSRIKARGMVV